MSLNEAFDRIIDHEYGFAGEWEAHTRAQNEFAHDQVEALISSVLATGEACTPRKRRSPTTPRSQRVTHQWRPFGLRNLPEGL